METWVESAAQLTKPDKIVFCDGSEAENQVILHEMLKHVDSFQLNEKTTSTAAAPATWPAPST
jgi:phosphoenolpyruvate carboxykinase (GTP)